LPDDAAVGTRREPFAFFAFSREIGYNGRAAAASAEANRSAEVQRAADRPAASAAPQGKAKPMRKFSFLLAGTLLLASASAFASPRLDPEARLARALEGRVAGAPVDCIMLYNIHSTQVIDHVAILYEAGDTIFVNRPQAGREQLDQWDTLVTRTSTSQLCSIDVVALYDTSARMETGSVFLGDFVPYRKVRARRSD
jgi:hypothetical protein